MSTGNGNGFISKMYCFFSFKKNHLSKPAVQDSLVELLNKETRKLIQDIPLQAKENGNPHNAFDNLERDWFVFVNRVSNRVLFNFADYFMNHVSGADLFKAFHTIGSAGGIYTLLAPYFLSYSFFTKDREFAEKIETVFKINLDRNAENDRSGRIAHFTDSVHNLREADLNTYRHIVNQFHHTTIVTCCADNLDPVTGIRNFKPIGVYEIDSRAHQKIYYPPLLEILDYVYEGNFSHIHLDTPGPIGWVALAIAKILKFPVTGTYMDSIRHFSELIKEDEFTEDLTWKFLHWFYDQLDTIFVHTPEAADELVERDIRPEKIKLIPESIGHPSTIPNTYNPPIYRNDFFQDPPIPIINDGHALS
jgi:hypothetical protein